MILKIKFLTLTNVENPHSNILKYLTDLQALNNLKALLILANLTILPALKALTVLITPNIPAKVFEKIDTITITKSNLYLIIYYL